jgi:hypothetical protein
MIKRVLEWRRSIKGKRALKGEMEICDEECKRMEEYV